MGQIEQRLIGPAGAPLSLMVERLSTPGQFLDWTGSTGAAPTVNVAACAFSATPTALTLALVESAKAGQFPVELSGTTLAQWTPGDYAFSLVDASGTTTGGVEVDIAGAGQWAVTPLPVANGRVTACTPGTNGTITLSGWVPGPSGSYAPSGVFGTATYVPGCRLRFTAGSLITTETGPCTAHTNNGDGTATFTFASAPAVATDGTAEAIVRGS